jgi:hypothetical protein
LKPERLKDYKNKPVYLKRFDCTMILRAAKAAPDGKGGYHVIVKLQDRRIKNSYVVARADDVEEVKP